MHILRSELSGRYYAVKRGYKPGQTKHDVTPYIEEIVRAERERCARICDTYATVGDDPARHDTAAALAVKIRAGR